MKVQVYLFLGTGLSCFPVLAFGQCVVTEDCAVLGYTASSCPGKGLKCPFGNGWFCAGDESSICAENGFKYSCTGTGYAGGAGFACGGKYTQCNCTTNYAWNGSSCALSCSSAYQYTCTGTGYAGGAGSACGGKYTQCNCAANYVWNGSSCALSCSSSYQYTCTGTGYAGGAGSACGGKYTQCNCVSGYEWKNGSCQKQVQNGAVGDLYYCNGKVVGVKTSGMNFYVAMKDLGTMDWSNASSSCKRYLFCGNLKGILPTKDQLFTMYNNKSSLNSLLSTNGGTKLSNGYYWSLTYDGNVIGHTYFIVSMSDGDVRGNLLNLNYYVRPVLDSY